MTSRTLFQPSVRYLSGARGLGFLNLQSTVDSFNKGFSQTSQNLVKWFDPQVSIDLLNTGVNAFKTVTGQGAQEQAQANLLQLQQLKAQQELGASAQLQQTIQAALPWVIGGGVLLVGAVIITKALK